MTNIPMLGWWKAVTSELEGFEVELVIGKKLCSKETAPSRDDLTAMSECLGNSFFYVRSETFLAQYISDFALTFVHTFQMVKTVKLWYNFSFAFE